ncbi:MAG: DNA polymerase III subunit alpha [Candidatus Delongbacteria bacterium]|nr:DNA polymerase III subunit alpha [Candidatus Delongbacteria bacterium]
MSFVHLHNHSHYSTLDGLSKPKNMIQKAVELKQTAMAITDHGNMMGVIDFYKNAKKQNVKPIIGIEAYLVNNRKVKEKGEKRNHLVLLAKNTTGYKNLIYMSTQASLTGFYHKPRIDYKLLEEHSEGLIGLSACLAGEIPRLIIDNKTEEARKAALKYQNIFGKGNFYLEVQYHPEIAEQEKVNRELLRISKETGIGLVATNDTHYVEKDDDIIQDVLVCVNTGKILSEQNNRLCMMGGNYSILSTQEMEKNFKDYPGAIENTVKIADMCNLEIEFDQSLLPKYECPDGMTEDAYLTKLCDIGLNKRYGIDKDKNGKYILSSDRQLSELPIPFEEIIERLEFELKTVNNMEFPGYFLIVQDFVNWAKENGILVGPGRGSAAGSVISYLTGITNVDPLKYGLLFERFLNPERISMPDIDIDIQDDERDKVLDYVKDKYGRDNVCQVVTYQTMAAKNSIRDIGRVMDIPLDQVNKITEKISGKPGTTISSSLKEKDFKSIYDANKLNKELIDKANRIEGTIRGTGTHACAVIISDKPVHEYVPLQYPPKDSKTVITQYEGPQLDDLGLLKMDFLGLRTLSIIANALKYIKKQTGKSIDIDNIPFNDKKVYDLFSQGNTNGIFQFESAGMKKHLRELKPDKFEYLYAMNALYRPGPMDYIPSFIARKHGKEKVEYDHPLMEKYLKDTYGITVYQEQVMILSRELAGFTRGESDMLRKAMGKKIKKLLADLKKKFVKGCNNNQKFIDGCKEYKVDINKTVEKIWSDWEAFGNYAFNRSHSVCYAYVAYQSAYLKVNYPIQFMTAMLNSVKNNSDKVLEYIDECENMNIEIVRPDVNYSGMEFEPTEDGKISFGLLAIKNVGEKAIESIINTREGSGIYKNIYDFLDRIDISKANKRTIEHLSRAGALDSLGHKRSQIVNSLEDLLPHFQKIASRKLDWDNSLFGDETEHDIVIDHPPLLDIDEYDKNSMLEQEKELIGLYVSGHPLDKYKDLIKALSINQKVLTTSFTDNYTFTLGGMLRNKRIRSTKTNNLMANLTVTTYYGDEELVLFPKKFEEYNEKLLENEVYFFKLRFQRQGEYFSLIVDEVYDYERAKQMFGEKTNTVKINFNPQDLNEIIVENFIQHLQNHKGNKELYFKVSGQKEKEILLKSSSYKVSGSLQFVKGVKQILGENSIDF